MSDTSNDNDSSPERSLKRRKKQPHEWKQNKRKQARLRGEEYVSTSGKTISRKMVGEISSCSDKCTEQILQDEKQAILSKLHEMKSKDQQDTYLMGLMEVKPIARRRKSSRNCVKTATFSYWISQHGRRKRVCKKAFLRLHAISNSRLQRLNKLLREGRTPVDLRGKHNIRRHVLPLEVTAKIKEQIESFPTKISHYSSKKTIKYLDGRLNVKTMYELFIKKWPDLDVKYEYYFKYFNENYSLRFGRPQVDVCGECERLGTALKDPNLNDNAKRVHSAELMVHKRRAKNFYSQLEAITKLCNEREDVCAISFDYMQNLPLPNIPVQEIFYFRQLWVYAFQVHNLKTNKGHFYTYHEGQAHKGPDEVCSFLLHYIENNIPPEITELHLFCDECPGQNRNHTMVRFLMTLTATKRFKKIVHYFPLRGHSFLPCDRDFGSIKRVIRRADRIYLPEDYEQMILSSRKVFPFTLTTIRYEDIIDFKNWWPHYYKKTTKSADEHRANFTISQYSQFTYTSDTPGYVTTSDFIGGFLSHTFYLIKPNMNPQIPIEKAYQEAVPINTKKIADLKQLLPYFFDETLEFYYHIISWKVKNEDSSEK
nr:unnamed protein product [Callosobruchus analis]